MKNIKMNPVLKKEMKISMRSIKSSVVVAIYLGILVLTLCGSLYLESAYRGMIIRRDATIAFVILMIIQFSLISLIAPTITAGAISGEREKQTLDILLTTDMKFSSIITGKLYASLSRIVLLILTSIPIFIFLLSYIGINLKYAIWILIMNLITAAFVGSIGLYASTYFKKTMVATVVSYIVIFLIYVLPVIICGITQIYSASKGMTPLVNYDRTYYYILVSPAVGFVSLILSQLGISVESMFGSTLSLNYLGLKSYGVTAIIMIILTIILIILATRRINPMRERRKKIKEKKK